MSERTNRLVCMVALTAASCGVAVGAVRWLGSATLVQLVEPLGRAPLFVGVVGPQLLYAMAQALPGGRDPVWLVRPPNDGWATALALCLLCAVLAAFPARPGAPMQSVFTLPFVLISAVFAIDRVRRVSRHLVVQQPQP